MYPIGIQAIFSIAICLAITGCLDSPVIIRHDDIISVDDFCLTTQLPYTADENKHLELKNYVEWLHLDNNANVNREMVINKIGNADMSSIVTRKTRNTELACIEDIYILSINICELGSATYYLFSYTNKDENALNMVTYFSDGIPKETTLLQYPDQ